MHSVLYISPISMSVCIRYRLGQSETYLNRLRHGISHYPKHMKLPHADLVCILVILGKQSFPHAISPFHLRNYKISSFSGFADFAIFRSGNRSVYCCNKISHRIIGTLGCECQITHVFRHFLIQLMTFYRKKSKLWMILDLGVFK